MRISRTRLPGDRSSGGITQAPETGWCTHPPCLLENVTPPDPKGQDMAAALRGSLGRDPSRHGNWRTLAMGSRPPGELEPVLPVMPSRVLAPPTCSPQGPFPPAALFVAAIHSTTAPSDSRCAALAFTLGLYEPRCPDTGCTDGSLVFRSPPCPRAAPPTPPRSRSRTPPDQDERDVAFAVKSAARLSGCKSVEAAGFPL